MKRRSQKKVIRDRKRKEAYAKFDETNDGVCQGCGLEKPGSHSHIIPISEAPELEAEIDNITWHCIQCHKKYESHNIDIIRTMLDFEKNMNYIKCVRPLYYNRLIS